MAIFKDIKIVDPKADQLSVAKYFAYPETSTLYEIKELQVCTTIRVEGSETTASTNLSIITAGSGIKDARIQDVIFFASEADFLHDKPSKLLTRNLACFVPVDFRKGDGVISKHYTASEDGSPVEHNSTAILITTNGNAFANEDNSSTIHPFDDKCYPSIEEFRKWNNYIVIGEDGASVTRTPFNARLQLNDEQRRYFAAVVKAINEAKAHGVGFVHNMDYSEILGFNAYEVSNVEYSDDIQDSIPAEYVFNFHGHLPSISMESYGCEYCFVGKAQE